MTTTHSTDTRDDRPAQTIKVRCNIEHTVHPINHRHSCLLPRRVADGATADVQVS
jgi:hypothetical protein